MKKASITVFLSLILMLVFSFVLSAIEAARIRGATAYVSMLTSLAGDSLLASYYYPLFQQYRLFGVDMGNEEGFFSESLLAEELKEDFSFGIKGLSGGLLRFQNTGIGHMEYETMLAGGEEEFLAQIRQQIVLDGLSLGLNELFSAEQFTEAGVVGEVYREQEEALAVTATVTSELVRLMELVDGIRMKDGGIFLDEHGKMQAEDGFIKQLLPLEKSELEGCYDNEEIYHTVSDKFFRADKEAEKINRLISEVESLEDNISWSESMIRGYKDRLRELETEWKAEKRLLETAEVPEETRLKELEAEIEAVKTLLQTEENSLWDYEAKRDEAISEAKVGYKELKKKIETVEELLKDALDIVDTLEEKQKKARISVGTYEMFLEGIQPKLSEELYQVFLQELDKMKIYAGLDERGFSVELMRQSLKWNQNLLEELSFSGFSTWKLARVSSEMATVKKQTSAYTAEGLWFSYGDIVVAEQSWNNVTGFLAELLTTGILELVGVSEEELSDRVLDGKDLPSAGLEKEALLDELLACIEEVQSLFQKGGIGEVLKEAGNVAWDGTALELYSMKYFHCYGETSPYSRLNYEREYLVFGDEKDKSNLFSMVLYLIAIRTLFCMVMILKHPDRMTQLETLSLGVAGFTGIPLLAAIVKYSVLLLWSVEEALVEVTALLQGKRIAIIGVGMVSFGELLAMNKTNIAGKAGRIPDGMGAAYQDYLALISLTKGTTRKAYRAMDLIQENIRYRYKDSFRIRNLVTSVSVDMRADLNKLFDVGLFPASVYEIEGKSEHAY